EEKRLRTLWRETQNRLASTRDALAAIERRARETEARLAAVAEARTRAETGRAEAAARLTEIKTELAALDAAEDPSAHLPEVQATTQGRRNALAAAQGEVAAHARDHAQRKQRIETIAADRARWTA